MKFTRTLFAIAIMGIAALQSCSKSKNSTPSYAMTASINGSSFSKSCVAQKTAGMLSISTFTGTSVSYPYIILTIPVYKGAGTYDISTADGSAALNTSSASVSLATSGTIVITATSPNITGTFNFTTDNTKVTNGTFTAVAP
jgi:hypothetical protein